MQCACAILSSVSCPALDYFFILTHKRNDFWKKKFLNINCVFLCPLQLLSEIFLILRRADRDMIKHVYWSSCNKVTVVEERTASVV